MNIRVSVDPVALPTSILPSALALKMLTLSMGGLSTLDRDQEGASRPGSVRVLPLPIVAEVGNGSVFSPRHEDGVEAEAFAAALCACNPPFEHTRAAVLGALG